MVMAPHIGDSFMEWAAALDDRTLGVVDFSNVLHLDYPGWPGNTLAMSRSWAAEIDGPSYAIDDQATITAITVVDDPVKIVSEGQLGTTHRPS